MKQTNKMIFGLILMLTLVGMVAGLVFLSETDTFLPSSQAPPSATYTDIVNEGGNYSHIEINTGGASS